MARRRLALILAVAVAAAPGCSTVGRATHGAYAWGSSTFTPNPVSNVSWYTGLGLGVLVGLPLCLITWPLSLLGYPEEDEKEFFLSSCLSPSMWLGTGLGSLLGAIFYPFGLPWVPDDPEAEPPDEPDPQ